MSLLAYLRRVRLGLPVLLLACVAIGAGASTVPRVERLSVEHGLSQSSVNAMVEDSIGRIWVGTQYALDRHDGQGFETLRPRADETSGLRDGWIQALQVARDGKLWIGHRRGIDRLDPERGSVQWLRLPASVGAHPAAEALLSADDDTLYAVVGSRLVRARPGNLHAEEVPFAGTGPTPGAPVALHVDSRRVLWLNSASRLYRHDATSDRMQEIPLPEGRRRSGCPACRRGGALAEHAGQLLAGTADGLFFLDGDGQPRQRLSPTRYGFPEDAVDGVAVTPDGRLWLLMPEGIAVVDSGDWRTLARFPMHGPEYGDHRPFGVAQDALGWTWIASQHGVLVLSRDASPTWLEHDPNDPGSLPPTTPASGYRLLADQDGTIWIGSGLGGLARHSPWSRRFRVLSAPAVAGQSRHDIVRAIVEERREDSVRLWVAYDGHGVRAFVPRGDGHESQMHLHHRAEAGRRLPMEHVWGLALDPAGGRLWIANHLRLVVVDTATGNVVWHGEPLPGSAAAGVLESLAFCRDGGELWVAAAHGVLALSLGQDRLPRSHRHFRLASAGENARAIDLYQASDGRWLVATDRGLGVIDGQREEVRLLQPEASRVWGRQHLFALAEPVPGELWLGSRAGLAQLALPDSTTGSFPADWLTLAHGLVDESIYALQADSSGRLWMSSNRGLMMLDRPTRKVRAFSLRDGLPGLEFSSKAGHAGHQGRLYFGAVHGLVMLDPGQLTTHPKAPRLRLKRLRVGDSDLSLADAELGALTTPRSRSRLEVEYVAVHSHDPGRIRHAFRLSGLEADWIDVGNDRIARYPALAPGQYRFELRAANPDGLWSAPRQLFAIEVLPSPWQTLPALLAYALLIAAGVGLYILSQRRRRRHLESMVAARTAELSEQKAVVDGQARALAEALESRNILFANVSHELRTPLMLIQASLEQFGSAEADPSLLATGRYYLQRLIRLVDQLLTLARAGPDSEAGPPWQLSELVTTTTAAFQPLLAERDVRLRTRVEGNCLVRAPRPQVECILLNLLSNAARFCRSGGVIEVAVDARGEGLDLSVSDEGPGIDESERERIFERFHRVPRSEVGEHAGAGIGLALVRELSHAIGGHVWVESAPGIGSRFVVRVPGTHVAGFIPESRATPPHERVERERVLLAESPPSSRPQDPPCAAKRLGNLLLVEDNADLRALLHRALASEWRVVESADGAEALELARERSVDLVVSDIMMPGRMDGLALLRALREDLRTSHLPVLLLTARGDPETLHRGLDLAADDYLVKPVQSEQLRLRLRRLVENRRRLRDFLLGEAGAPCPWSGASGAGPDVEHGDSAGSRGLAISSRDRRLLERLDAWLDARVSDPAITLDGMAAAVAVDARTLQRKLKALVGLTPNAYLRDLRLRRARQLLRETDRSVTDIALSCGFGSLQYFSRVFHRAHGESAEHFRNSRAGHPG